MQDISDLGPDRSLLLVDDDEPFLRRLAKAMEKRGFEIETAGSVAAGRAIATARSTSVPSVAGFMSDAEMLAERWPMKTRRPMSSPSDRSTSSSAPKRTDTLVDALQA